MAEPTSAYTLADLMLRVAKAASVAYYGANGDERAQVPVDDDTFYRCLDVVNDGIKFFIASAPVTGWWWMKRDMEVTFDPNGVDPACIDGDASRYLLPDDFQGEVTGPISYTASSNRGHMIGWVSDFEMRSLREVQVLRGYPIRANLKPYANRQWQITFDPSPSVIATVTFPYRVGFDKFDVAPGDDLTENKDHKPLTHPAGALFDQGILAACLAQAELEFEDLKLGYMDKFLTLDLKKAYEIDGRLAPLSLGMMLPGTRWDRYYRVRNDVVKKPGPFGP